MHYSSPTNFLICKLCLRKLLNTKIPVVMLRHEEWDTCSVEQAFTLIYVKISSPKLMCSKCEPPNRLMWKYFYLWLSFLNSIKALLFCECKTNAITSHQNPVFAQWEYSRHQTKAAMQLELKFNIINLIIVHNYLTVLQIGFKGWYCNWLWIIKEHAVKIMLPGWWWVTSLSYPGSRLWEQMAPVTTNESWRMETETVAGCEHVGQNNDHQERGLTMS